jgi:hypothetical protein
VLFCVKKKELSNPYEALISVLLPEGILDYFDIVNLISDKSGLSIYLDEKNVGIKLKSWGKKNKCVVLR